MKTKIQIVIPLAVFFCSVLSSCSSTSLKKSILYSSLAGCPTAGAAGYFLAPGGNENKNANAILWCGVGAIVAGAVGYYLYEDDPRNGPLKESLAGQYQNQDQRNQNLSVQDLEIGQSKITINPTYAPLNAYTIKDDLPDSLKSKISPRRVYEQEVPEQKILDRGRVIVIDSHKAYIISSEEEEGVENSKTEKEKTNGEE